MMCNEVPLVILAAAGLAILVITTDMIRTGATHMMPPLLIIVCIVACTVGWRWRHKCAGASEHITGERRL